MTEPDAVPDEWQVESDRHPEDWNWEDPDDGWDWVQMPDQPATQAAPGPPWYRGPKLLLGLIGLAAAALVVATALLVGGRFSGEIPTSRQLNTRTATATPRTSPPTPTDSQPTSTTARSSESTTESSTEPSPEPFGGPEQNPEPVAPPPPPAGPEPPAPAPRRDEGPRINVTRTPMSFTPTMSGRP